MIQSKNEQVKTADKKILTRREGTIGGRLPWLDRRNAKTWRHATQIVFMAINFYLCLALYVWVRYYETGGESLYMSRPAGFAAWLPIAGLLNLKYFLSTLTIPPIHAAALFLLVAFLLISLLLKKAFCSWICPIGTLSELFWQLGKKLFGRNFNLPKWLDIPLRGLKYLLLGLVLYLVIPMPAMAIASFLSSPYGIISDVKMMNFLRFAGSTTLIVFSLLIVGSLFIQNLWCRYLCPYGALMGLVSLLSPFKIRRDVDACIDCGKCAKACPSRIPVDRLIQVRTVECSACMSCVEVCPAKDALQFAVVPMNVPINVPANVQAQRGSSETISRRWRERKLSGARIALIIAAILLAIMGYAKFSQRWDIQHIPETYYQKLVPQAQFIGH